MFLYFVKGEIFGICSGQECDVTHVAVLVGQEAGTQLDPFPLGHGLPGSPARFPSFRPRIAPDAFPSRPVPRLPFWV